MTGFVQDIEDLAVRNDEFRRVLYTATQCADAEADSEHFDGKKTE